MSGSRGLQIIYTLLLSLARARQAVHSQNCDQKQEGDAELLLLITRHRGSKGSQVLFDFLNLVVMRALATLVYNFAVQSDI